MKTYLTGAIALAFLSMSGLVSAQGTTDPSTMPSTTQTDKSTTQKAKHHHKHAHKATKAKAETPKQ